MAVIGLDLGATKLAGALFGADGTVKERSSALLERRVGDDVARLINEHLRRLRTTAAARGEHVAAIGVSVPGIAHHDGGTVWAPNIPAWERYPLRDMIAAEAGPGCVVLVESDRACSILGEVALGCARGCRHAVFLAVGTGIGAGILVDGSILRGAHDIAGAIGWMGLDRPYRREYDECGGFESNASGAGIARVAREYLQASPDYQGPLRAVEPEQLSAHEVFAAHKLGDTLAARIVANAVECWGMAVANLVSLFDPEIVVLGGGLFGPAAAELDRIVREARRWAQPVSFGKVAVRVSALGPEACLFGCGELALQGVKKG
jgi:glucokinase